MKQFSRCLLVVFFSAVFCGGEVFAVICGEGFGVVEGTCTPCPAGWYSGGGNNAVCTKCTAGTYSSAVGASYCKNCTAGTYSSSDGAIKCTICPAGTYSSSGASSCTVCAAGTYAVAGAGGCITCSVGTYSGEGAASCTLCPAGTYSEVTGAIDISSCKKCAMRTYSDAGASVCEPCPAGRCCAHGIAYACVKGTWSPGNEVCQIIQYNVNPCQQEEGRGGTGDSGGTNVSGGDGGTCSQDDLSTYKKGFCLNECSGACTTSSVGAASEAYCTVKTVKKFKYNNSASSFEWPKDGSVSEQYIKSSADINFEATHCPAI